MKTEINKLTARSGKVFRRVSDKEVFGNELSLGYTYYLNGEKLEEPLLELPEHYEEIDEPVTPETVILDEETPLVEDLPEAEMGLTDEPVVQKVTVEDYRKLEEIVRIMKEKLGL